MDNNIGANKANRDAGGSLPVAGWLAVGGSGGGLHVLPDVRIERAHDVVE